MRRCKVNLTYILLRKPRSCPSASSWLLPHWVINQRLLSSLFPHILHKLNHCEVKFHFLCQCPWKFLSFSYTTPRLINSRNTSRDLWLAYVSGQQGGDVVGDIQASGTHKPGPDWSHYGVLRGCFITGLDSGDSLEICCLAPCHSERESAHKTFLCFTACVLQPSECWNGRC